jgi:hypothetical protein
MSPRNTGIRPGEEPKAPFAAWKREGGRFGQRPPWWRRLRRPKACGICGHPPHDTRMCVFGKGVGPTMCACMGSEPR